MKGVKIILIAIALLLFVSSYAICDYFYYNETVKDLNLWWDLKANLYAIIVMLVFLSSVIGSKGKLRFILDIGFGLAFSNVIDKVFFDVLIFRYNDIIMIILTICAAALDYVKNGGENK